MGGPISNLKVVGVLVFGSFLSQTVEGDLVITLRQTTGIPTTLLPKLATCGPKITLDGP